MVRDVPGGAGRGRRHGRAGASFLTPGLLLGLGMAMLSVGAGCAVGHVGGTGAGSSRVEVSLVPQGPSTGSDRTAPAHTSQSRRASASSAASAQHRPGARPSPSASTHRPAGTVSRGLRLTDAATTGSATPAAPSATASATPAAFLPIGACVAAATGTGGSSYSEVGCDTRNASAVVIRRLASGTPATSCPSGTDFALQITSIRTYDAGTATATSKAQVTGVACLRNLHAPHPGDPGGGGGFGIVVGDCMEDTGGGTLRETACDATGADRPDYRVIGLVARNDECPNATTAYITVHNPGSPVQVACAVSLRNGG